MDSLSLLIQEHSFAASLPDVFVHLLALALIGTAIILLNRTANATKSSRFLRHIAFAFGVVFFFRLGMIIVALSKSLLAMQYAAQGLPVAPADRAIEAKNALDGIDSMWNAISMILSYLSTFWLLLAWWLLRQYPQEGIPRGLYATAIGVLTLLVGLAAGIVRSAQANSFRILNLVDVLSSAGVIVLVGWQLMKLTPKRGHPALSGVVFVLYSLWGLMQIPILLFKIRTDSTYYMVLMFSGFAAMLSTVMHTSIVLEDKEEYKSSSGHRSRTDRSTKGT